MLNFNDDIIRLITTNLELKDMLNLSNVCYYINDILDSIFFKNIADKMYSKEFWEKAKKRPIKISKPLGNIKKELIRIERFQLFLIDNKLNKWDKKEFYFFWSLWDKL